MKAKTDSSIQETKRYIHQRRVVERLIQSEIFKSYQKVFQSSTGLPLELSPVQEGAAACRGVGNQNRFCELLNNEGDCEECMIAQKCLATKNGRGLQSITCFAGLQETVIPIMLGSDKIAHLQTGQIIYKKPDANKFDELYSSLPNVKSSKGELRTAYMNTTVIEKERYRALVTLLAAFSLQLAKLANLISIEEEIKTEDSMVLAKDYIESNLTEEIHLDDVSAQVHMSSFHFCRKFKESTGMTLTNYVSHRRVEMAKEALEDVNQRITDIAFNVGFQSLSQFNRSFRKIVGLSPTQYRKSAA